MAQSGRLLRNRASGLVTDEDQVGNCLRGAERELDEVQGLYSGRRFLVAHGLRSLQNPSSYGPADHQQVTPSPGGSNPLNQENPPLAVSARGL